MILLLLPSQKIPAAAAGKSWKAKEFLWLTSTPSSGWCRKWLLRSEEATGKAGKLGIDPKKLGAAPGLSVGWPAGSSAPAAEQGPSQGAGSGICQHSGLAPELYPGEPRLALLENGENSRAGPGEALQEAGTAQTEPGADLGHISVLQVTKRSHEGTAPPQALWHQSGHPRSIPVDPHHPSQWIPDAAGGGGRSGLALYINLTQRWEMQILGGFIPCHPVPHRKGSFNGTGKLLECFQVFSAAAIGAFGKGISQSLLEG